MPHGTEAIINHGEHNWRLQRHGRGAPVCKSSFWFLAIAQAPGPEKRLDDTERFKV